MGGETGLSARLLKNNIYGTDVDLRNTSGPLCIYWPRFSKTCRALASLAHPNDTNRFLFEPSWMQIVFRQAEEFGSHLYEMRMNSHIVMSHGAKGEFKWVKKFQRCFGVDIVERGNKGQERECEIGTDDTCFSWLNDTIDRLEDGEIPREDKIITLVSANERFIPFIDAAVKRDWKIVIWTFSESIGRAPDHYSQFLKENDKSVTVAFLDEIFYHVGYLKNVIYHHTLMVKNRDVHLSHLRVVEAIMNRGFRGSVFCIRWSKNFCFYINFEKRDDREKFVEFVSSGQVPCIDFDARIISMDYRPRSHISTE